MGVTAGDILFFQSDGTKSLAPLQNTGLLSPCQLHGFSQIPETMRKVPSDTLAHTAPGTLLGFPAI